MTRQSLRRPNAQAGFTLAEILVATAVFLIIFLGAMMLYDRSNQVFKQGVEASDMQQNTRVAFDKVIADIRMAGFDFDRDGRPAGGTVLAWRPNTLYGRGASVSPTDPLLSSNAFRCEVAGKSGATAADEPDWTATYSCLSGSECVNDASPVVWVKKAGTAEYQQPDEQLEYVGRSAITVRANFNYEDPLSPDNGREGDYEPAKGQFPIVTTSNKEIATYALRSDRGKNEDDITFYADITKPRSSYPGGPPEEAVTIGKFDDCMTGGVWDGCKQPPYTLYRVTLADDYATTGKTIETPIASNIRSLRFTYYEDIAGTEALRDLAATPAVEPNGGAIGGDGIYDPKDGSVIIPDRLIRQKIKSIGVELVGMGEAPDFNYTNPDETASAYTDTSGRLIEPTRYREYHIESLVSPRNIGKHGMREQDVLPPGPPELTRILVGACGIITVEWNPPKVSATSGAVEQYQVEWKQCTGAADCTLAGTFTSEAPTLDTSWAVPNLDPAFKYIFRVKAFNGYGSDTSKDAGFWDGPLNRTKPEVPSGLVASSSGANQIDLNWTRPLKPVSGDLRIVTSGGTETAGTILASEIVGYEVYRSTSPLPDPPLASQLIFNGPLSTDPISGVVHFPDDKITNCTTYYYKVRAVEKCFEKDSYNEGPAPNKSYAASDFTAEVTGESKSTATPAAPGDLQLTSTLISGFDYDILLRWPRVSTDTTGAPLNVTYEIEKVQFNEDGTDGPDKFPRIPVPFSSDPTVTYHDTASLHDASGTDKVYYLYRVYAENCGFESGGTDKRRWPCDFDTSITLGYSPEPASFQGDGMSPAGAWLVSGVTGIRADVSSAGVTIHADLYNAADGALIKSLDPYTTTVSPDSWVFGTGGLEDGVVYRVDFTAMDAKGCMKYDSRYIEESPAGCCLAPNDFTTVVDRGVGSVTLKLVNLCDTPLTLDPNGIVIAWTNTVPVKPGSKPTLLKKVTYDGGVVDPALDGSKPAGVSDTPPTVLLSSAAIAAGAPRTIAAGGSYTVTLEFSTDSFTFDCATGIYKRLTATPPDVASQTCRFYPATDSTSCP